MSAVGLGGGGGCQLDSREYVKMAFEFPANGGSKERKLLPGLPALLVMEDKCLGFLPCNLRGCGYAYATAGSPHPPLHLGSSGKGFSKINF